MIKFFSFFILLVSGGFLAASGDFRDNLAKISNETAKKIESKYNVAPCGSGCGAFYGVELVSLSFDVKRPVTVDEARAIMVGSLECYQQALNANKSIRPYLEEYPFPAGRIKLAFFIQNEKSKPSDLKLFSISPKGDRGIATITYCVTDENNRFKDVLKETYDEAKEHINEKQ